MAGLLCEPTPRHRQAFVNNRRELRKINFNVGKAAQGAVFMDHVQEMEAIKRLLIERGVRILIAEVHDHMGSPWTIECDTTPPIYVTADGRDGGFKVEYWADYDRTERLWFQFPEMESVLYMPFSEYKRESAIDAVVRTIGRSTAWRR